MISGKVQHKAHNSCYTLSQNSRVGCTGNSQFRENTDTKNQNRVKNNIQHSTGNLRNHTFKGASRRLQKSLKGHLEKQTEGEQTYIVKISIAVGCDIRITCL